MQQYNIALDIGSNTLHMAQPDGVSIERSSAIVQKGDDVLFYGDGAYQLVDRVAFPAVIAYPVQNGAVANSFAYKKWIRHLLREAPRGRGKVLFAVPYTVETAVRKEIGAWAMEAGAASCGFIDLDIASAVGAGVDIFSDDCKMLLDVGAQSVTCSVFAGENILRRGRIPFGAEEITKSIQRTLESKYNFAIGYQTAEEIKRTLSGLKSVSMPVSGLDRATGFPAIKDIPAQDIQHLSDPLFAQITNLVQSILGNVSPECLDDLQENGITLLGGGAQSFALEETVKYCVKLPVSLSADCPNASARGLHAILKDIAPYEAFVTSFDELLAQ